MSVSIEEQISTQYEKTIEANPGLDEAEVRLAIVANFADAYMKSIFQTIYAAETEDEKMSAVLAIEMMSILQELLDSIKPDMTVEVKIEKFIRIFENVASPSYDLVKDTQIHVPLIDQAKSDFAEMADFLRFHQIES